MRLLLLFVFFLQRSLDLAATALSDVGWVDRGGGSSALRMYVRRLVVQLMSTLPSN